MNASYGDRKLPFTQYKVIRETFFAGMIAGFRNTVEICANPSEDEAERQLTLDAEVIEKMAIGTAWAKFEGTPARGDENFEKDKAAWLEKVRHH